MERLESVWRQRHPVLELGWSAYLSPGVSAPAKGREGLAYGGLYFGCCYLCDGQPWRVEKSTVRSSARVRRPREAAPKIVALEGRDHRAQAPRLGPTRPRSG